MPAEPLTQRQSKVLKFIERNISLSGYPPTLREIGNAFGIKSTNGVNDHLRALMRKGYLAKESGKSRTLKLLIPKQKKPIEKLQQVGSIPIFDDENVDDEWLPTGLFAVMNHDSGEISICRKELDGRRSILATFHFAL